jgi:hypothetical protein
MRVVAIIAILLVGLALSAAVAWNAAEAHYQGCVQAAQMLPDKRNDFERTLENRHKADPHAASVYKRVRGCSRWP